MDNKISLGEALEKYAGKLDKAIGKILSIDEVEAQRVIKNIPLDDYLNLAKYIDMEDIDSAKKILNKYIKKEVSVESVQKSIIKAVKENKAFVIPTDTRHMTSIQLRSMLESFQTSVLQKILANTNGYATVGLKESDMFDDELIETIVENILTKSIDDMISEVAGRPGEQNRQQAYGSEENSGSSPATSKASDKQMATFTNDDGEQEDGEVISQDSRSVTVKSKKGTKKIDISKAIVHENNIIKLSDYRGTK